jgi:1-deoxy-D-xylulose-5-phosphate synthase
LTMKINIQSPDELRGMSPAELNQLASDIREFLIEKVSRTGGHLGPNLGVVELTIAIHRVFQSPRDVVLFDTGHQSYVHKILTGRADQFDLLRQRDGISGYPNRRESEHDVIENSHASTALSWADGVSRGFSLTGQSQRHVVAVVGDGALTGGMSWEALNNLSPESDRNLVIVVNDNERSYSPTIGGLATYLTTLRASKEYERILGRGKRMLHNTPVVGKYIYGTLHGMKKGIKDMVAPQGMFEDLGFKYLGPIDGHDIVAMEKTLQMAKEFGSPVIVHAITEKGRGYTPALEDIAEKFHAVGIVDPVTGKPVKASAPSWTNAFSEEITQIGRENSRVVAITAAMLGPTGLDKFSQSFPERTIDVGIAEQHAVTSAAGLAYAGMHPVIAIYSTFLNRAFDQLLLDVALHNAGVTFVLDRAGITGDDGPSHHGIWDLALTGIVPNMRVGAPRDGARLKEILRGCVEITNAPSMVRFPKGAVPADIPALERVSGVDVLHRGASKKVLLISVGAMAGMALEVAQLAQAQGIEITVVDPVWVKPISPAVIALCADYETVVVVEDGIKHAGIASAISETLREAGSNCSLHSIGVPLEFIEHSKRNEILDDLEITPAAIVQQIAGWVS